MAHSSWRLLLNDSKVVRSWCMYDWANSVYSLVIISAIFPVYYKAVATTGGSDMVSFFGFQIQNSNCIPTRFHFPF